MLQKKKTREPLQASREWVSVVSLSSVIMTRIVSRYSVKNTINLYYLSYAHYEMYVSNVHAGPHKRLLFRPDSHREESQRFSSLNNLVPHKHEEKSVIPDVIFHFLRQQKIKNFME